MMVRIVSLSVLLTLIVVLGVTFFQVLAPFLLPLFLAGVFAILCQPLYRYFLDRTKRRVRLASALTTGTIVAIILIPLALLTVLSSLQLYVVATKLNDRVWTKTFRERTEPLLQQAADIMNALVNEPKPQDQSSEDPADDIREDDSGGEETAAVDSAAIEDVQPPISEDAVVPPIRPPPERDDADADASVAAIDSGAPVSQNAEASQDVPFTPAIIRARLEAAARDSLLDIGGKSLGTAGRTISSTLDVVSGAVMAIVSAVIGFLVFVIALYFFLADGTALLAATEKLIPVHVGYQRELLDQFARVVRSVVMATFFAALVQGLATVLGLWFFGFEHLLVLLVLAILTSMVPLLGTWPIWSPCALWLLWNGHWIQALLLTAYGVAFVGLLDNAVRTYILNTDAKLHPLLALISVLGGLKAMGLWGVFIGPVVASCLHALVKIFNHELKELSEEKFAGILPAANKSPPGGSTSVSEGRPASSPPDTKALPRSKRRKGRS